MLLGKTALVRLLGLRIPLLFLLAPRVEELDEESCAVLLRLGYLSRNHVGSMYLAALWAGADVAAGLHALELIRSRYPRQVPIFKDVRAEFLKLADGDVLFRCRQGRAVAEAMARAEATGERVTVPVEVVATVPEKHGEEPVARFALGLSVKRK